MRSPFALGRLLPLALLLIVALAAACGNSAGPDVTPSPSPVPEPTAVGDDDESQVRLTLELFAYYIDNERFDDVCDLYSEEVIAAVSCEAIKASFSGPSITTDVSASLRFDAVSVDGDLGVATYLMCLDVGSGLSCGTITVEVVREAGDWKIGPPQ